MEELNKNILIPVTVASFIIGLFIYLGENKRSPEYVVDNIPKAQVSESLPSSCLDINDVANFVAQEKCVRGKIEKVFISKSGTIFLDFCQDYKTCPFTAVIFKSDSAKFENIKELNGKTIELTGLIKTYKGQPEIIINEPSQIKIID